MESTAWPYTYGLAIALALLAVVSIVYRSLRNGITPMPSSAPVRRAVAAELSRIGSRGTLVEAGSGWGTLAMYIAKQCTGWRIIGVENSRIPYLFAKAAACFMVYRNVTFERSDLYAYPFGQVDAIVCYLYPGAMARLRPLLERQLAPGACVISVCFAMPGWNPERVITCRDRHRTRIYVYKN
ncbi:class I SAM-dependent methyltransferase [Paenibacillus sp. MMS18-CY102]|uniref:class I SAM-dependent methyltransferase n=1 Tax=Paenibacillus sp. MMS18-CY102 TaxID=2682849 RepID=UPI00136654BC|nr:class I SAM-dependent methyltransferase [Paenibacillus sp. MMS18-CY102]MWC29427.1 class I SAM-dependent methyltransferase [Paenibacillus sp. MMS18-CY102]